MNGFYISFECMKCDQDAFYGPAVTLVERNGMPVIPADMLSQIRFDCPECGSTMSTGDFDDIVWSDDND